MKDRPGFELTVVPQAVLVVALVLFTTAAVLGIWINSPDDRYTEPATQWLDEITATEFWDADENVGRRRASQGRVDTILDARPANADKAAKLTWAIAFEVSAVAMVGTSVVWMLWA